MPLPLAETTIVELEQGIVDRLKVKITNLAIEPFPAQPEDYRLVHQVGAILVAFRGARYTEPFDLEDVVQERDLWFDIHVLGRQLNGHQGVYVHLEAARLALTGHKVAGFKQLIPRREAFIANKSGVWTYALTMSAATIAAELDETTLGALLDRLTMVSEYTTSEIT